MAAQMMHPVQLTSGADSCANLLRLSRGLVNMVTQEMTFTGSDNQHNFATILMESKSIIKYQSVIIYCIMLNN